MSPGQAVLVGRLRGLLSGEPTVREVPMFGGRAFMVNDRLVVSAQQDGSLLVRADPARHDELLARAGATQAVMGAARTMGPGWITVAPDTVVDDGILASWVDVARQHHRTPRPPEGGGAKML
ncbi:TfoX/Sxy family protein [Arthrobacter sp. JSM 101049]|uniref:TfoX/Sxy family protein n=1 Tax=Arthrobacter sp. JSM 101049 TaxID=929097 RepID=UPI003562CD50